MNPMATTKFLFTSLKTKDWREGKKLEVQAEVADKVHIPQKTNNATPKQFCPTWREAVFLDLGDFTLVFAVDFPAINSAEIWQFFTWNWLVFTEKSRNFAKIQKKVDLRSIFGRFFGRSVKIDRRSVAKKSTTNTIFIPNEDFWKICLKCVVLP